jgi:hypothetical protein
MSILYVLYAEQTHGNVSVTTRIETSKVYSLMCFVLGARTCDEFYIYVNLDVSDV